MKRQFKFIALLAVLFLGFNFNAQAQAKIGHINSQVLISKMPEYTAAQKEMETYAKTADKELTDMVNEYQTKGKKYNEEVKNVTEATNMSRAKEMQDLEQRINEYRQNSAVEMKKKETDLLNPIYEKAQQAIDQVAKEKGLDYVLNIAGGSVIYWNDSLDITKAVQDKLGIK